jgi:hypothetical protein
MISTLQVVDVLGFQLPFYSSPTLLLSLGLSIRVLWYLITQRPNVIHVSTPGVMFLACTLYSRLLNIPLVMSYHTHIPEYIPKYTWAGLVHPMWSIIRWCTRMADLTLVTSKAMKVSSSRPGQAMPGQALLEDKAMLHASEMAADEHSSAAVCRCMQSSMNATTSQRLPPAPHAAVACAHVLYACLGCWQHRAPSAPSPAPALPALQDELERNSCRQKRIDIWQRGVDTEVFHPQHRSADMRERMTEGQPEAPLLVYVGRLGAGARCRSMHVLHCWTPSARCCLHSVCWAMQGV